jgi:hypothetical protein
MFLDWQQLHLVSPNLLKKDTIMLLSWTRSASQELLILLLLNLTNNYSNNLAINLYKYINNIVNVISINKYKALF